MLAAPSRSWQVGKQTIYNEDCLRILPMMNDGTIDVVVTSPPYNVGTRYGTYQDDQPREEYLQQLRRIFWHIDRVMKEGGSFFLNMGWKASDPWVSVEVALVARETFQLQNRIAWVKCIAIGDAPALGHDKPVNSPRYLNQRWEEIWHFTKRGVTPLDRLSLGVPYADKSNLQRGNRGKNGDLRCRGNTWFVPYETIQGRGEKGNHPAIFPVQLAENCIRLHGMNPSTQVLDPFAGMMSTLKACARLDVSGIGIELDDDYAAFGRQYLEEIHERG